MNTRVLFNSFLLSSVQWMIVMSCVNPRPGRSSCILVLSRTLEWPVVSVIASSVVYGRASVHWPCPCTSACVQSKSTPLVCMNSRSYGLEPTGRHDDIQLWVNRVVVAGVFVCTDTSILVANLIGSCLTLSCLMSVQSVSSCRSIVCRTRVFRSNIE